MILLSQTSEKVVIRYVPVVELVVIGITFLLPTVMVFSRGEMSEGWILLIGTLVVSFLLVYFGRCTLDKRDNSIILTKISVLGKKADVYDKSLNEVVAIGVEDYGNFKKIYLAVDRAFNAGIDIEPSGSVGAIFLVFENRTVPVFGHWVGNGIVFRAKKNAQKLVEFLELEAGIQWI